MVITGEIKGRKEYETVCCPPKSLETYSQGHHCQGTGFYPLQAPEWLREHYHTLNFLPKSFTSI